VSTAFPVTPAPTGAVQFSPTLDGQQYTCVILWSLTGQRLTVACRDSGGNLIFNVPLTESPRAQTIESLSYDELRAQAVGVTNEPHGLAIGSTTQLTVSGASPGDYDGAFLVLATGPDTFSYPLPLVSDPGAASSPGQLSYDISLAAGYFDSTMVYRDGVVTVSP
jgi:hypothetical protein